MSAIVWPKPHNDLTRLDRGQIISEICKKLKGRALAAYVFGSYSTQNHRPDSDIDLVIIKESETSFTQRSIEFSDLMDVYPAMDISVYTPNEFEQMQIEEDGFFKHSHLSKIF